MIRSGTIACALLFAVSGVAIAPCPLAAQSTTPQIAADPARCAREHSAADRAIEQAVATPGSLVGDQGEGCLRHACVRSWDELDRELHGIHATFARSA